VLVIKNHLQAHLAGTRLCKTGDMPQLAMAYHLLFQKTRSGRFISLFFNWLFGGMVFALIIRSGEWLRFCVTQIPCDFY